MLQGIKQNVLYHQLISVFRRVDQAVIDVFRDETREVMTILGFNPNPDFKNAGKGEGFDP